MGLRVGRWCTSARLPQRSGGRRSSLFGNFAPARREARNTCGMPSFTTLDFHVDARSCRPRPSCSCWVLHGCFCPRFATLPWAAALARLAPTPAWSPFVPPHRKERCPSGDRNVHSHSQLGADANGYVDRGVAAYRRAGYDVLQHPCNNALWTTRGWFGSTHSGGLISPAACMIQQGLGVAPSGQPVLGGRSGILA